MEYFKYRRSEIRIASEQVVPELTELEKVQQRIANYQIGINPQSASAVLRYYNYI